MILYFLIVSTLCTFRVDRATHTARPVPAVLAAFTVRAFNAILGVHTVQDVCIVSPFSSIRNVDAVSTVCTAVPILRSSLFQPFQKFKYSTTFTQSEYQTYSDQFATSTATSQRHVLLSLHLNSSIYNLFSLITRPPQHLQCKSTGLNTHLPSSTLQPHRAAARPGSRSTTYRRRHNQTNPLS